MRSAVGLLAIACACTGTPAAPQVDAPPSPPVQLGPWPACAPEDPREVRIEALARGVRGLGDMRDDAPVYEASLAALDLETAEVSSGLLLALSWEETRLDPRVRTGRVCGIMQVAPGDLGLAASSCRLWSHDVRAGMAAGLHEIEEMLSDPRVHGSLRRALGYRACGNSFFTPEGCGKDAWVNEVIRVSARLDSDLGK